MTSAHTYPVERRRKPRITLPFPITVRAVAANGTRFTTTVVVDSLSCQGLAFRLAQPIKPTARLFVLVRLSCAVSDAPSPHVAGHLHVLRVAQGPHGEYAVAGRLIHHRFLCVAA